MVNANSALQPSPRGKHAGSALLTILLTGLALRIYYAWKAYYLTFDSATIGLMALRILDGERPMFFYGQGYMGSLEAYLAAFWVYLLGPSDLAVSLAPITFSLFWVVFTYFLFKELAHPWAGVAAAATTALAGYYTMWYCVSNNGGYAPVFALGSLVLWRCVRVGHRRPGLKSLAAEVLIIGAASALALWCGLIVLPYLFTGAIWLLVYLWRSTQRGKTLALYAGGALLAAIGLLPSVMARADFPSSGSLTQFIFSGHQFKRSLEMLAGVNWPQLVLWDPKSLPSGMTALSRAVPVVIYLLLSAAALGYLARLGRVWRQGKLLLHLTPLIFGLFFLALYLPHRMSLLNSPRYLIFSWGIVLAALWALGPATSGSRAAPLYSGLLAIYLIFQLAGNLLFIERMVPLKTGRLAKETAVVRAAEANQIKDVVLIGGPTFGHQGQIYTFRAEDRVRFSSPWNERHQPTAQAAEGAVRYGLGLPANYRPDLEAALEDLRVAYELTAAGDLILAHHITPPENGQIAVPFRQLRLKLENSPGQAAAALADRNIDTVCAFQVSDGQQSSVTIDLGRTCQVNGFQLLAPDVSQSGLPLGYRLSASVDGTRFRQIQQVTKRLPVGYLAGPKVYLEGYFGRFEVRLPPFPARYLKLDFTLANERLEGIVRLAEIFVFEESELPAAARSPDLSFLTQRFQSAVTEFVFADRWISARLLEELQSRKGEYPALPRGNPQRYEYTRISREVRPRKGLALVLAQAVADEGEQLLREHYGTAAIAQRYDLPGYRVLILDDPGEAASPPAALVWTGHTLLKTARPEEFWR